MMNRLPTAGFGLARRCPTSRLSPFRSSTAIRTVFDNYYDERLWLQSDEANLRPVHVPSKPGSKAFVSSIEGSAVVDLFFQYATKRDTGKTGGQAQQPSLDLEGVHNLLEGIGESHDDHTVKRLFAEADLDNSGCVDLQEFLFAADKILGSAPARIVLIVGGPGSGKGLLSQRLEKEAGLVHLSSGDLLRCEVKRGTVLGKQVKEIMARGELVSSEIIVTLMRRRMRDHPGNRVLLDGFPRSMENALDLVKLCGKPELALHLECDDTILMERIMARAAKAAESEGRRADDNFHTALQRLRNYHKYHDSTIQFLREQHVPIVELDCSVKPDLVWEQLLAIGRMMRPAVQLPKEVEETAAVAQEDLPWTGTR
ncbi:Adenylate kinase [Seminavis robusta]|uniref:Adenylate kinase n=1 Tax=Seminavis robusta TaxID=568900 RepID=A0A9N8HED1_9STRA|nr:Adenylate kinase [Seminavis robusta]|eukprot:Sro400_g134970.1 Adenylate kinase (370) ;mRNA; r:1696-3044